MPSPSSYDLRVRVVAAVERGMGVKEASRTFGLHRETITTWLARKDATPGTCRQRRAISAATRRRSRTPRSSKCSSRSRERPL